MSPLFDLVVPESPSPRVSAGLLFVRVYAGLALMQHGQGKIANPLHWMDGAAVHPPGFLQFLAAVSEYLGGLALALGVLTPVAAFGIACTMAYAIWVHVAKGDPFVGRGGSFEPALGYFVTALLLVLAGPGGYSLDAMIARRLRGATGV